MKLDEKIAFLQDKHWGDWFTTRQQVSLEISDKQTMFCLCGRLATGLHESSCRKLQKKINDETVKRLEHLIV